MENKKEAKVVATDGVGWLTITKEAYLGEVSTAYLEELVASLEKKGYKVMVGVKK